MKQAFLVFLLLAIPQVAQAEDRQDCQDAAGAFLTGTVTSAPAFKPGGFRKGVELSHTHLTLRSDQDRQSYDVAIDNVFASGYDESIKAVPAPLNGITVGDRLELCGQLYTTGVGLHWVHTNCGVSPTAQTPDGWLKEVDTSGDTSDNLEDNTEYCSLWP